MSVTKISENTSNILFFKPNLHFVTSNWISTCRKLNLLLANSTYLIVYALLKQRRLNTDQSTLQVLLLCSKWNDSQTVKSSSCKIKFSSVYAVDPTRFDECFLFHVVTGRHYFWQKFVVELRFFQPPYCYFIWNKCFERSPYFTYFISTVQC